MKKLVSFCMLFFCSTVFAFPYPEVSILFPENPSSTVYYGETLRIPVEMNFRNLRIYKQWTMPKGSSLEVISGKCPSIPYDSGTYEQGTCKMNLVIPGNSLGGVISGTLKYHVFGEDRDASGRHNWDVWFFSPEFSVAVIPHNLSMLPIPFQEGTANQTFVYNLKSAVKFYDENVKAGFPVTGVVNPIEQDGLRFDPHSFSIEGTPTRIGTYLFQVGAQTINGTAASTDFIIHVNVNPKDTPVFKSDISMSSATPGQKYSVNLMELIELPTGFMVTNQISFRLNPNFNNPEWLHISSEDATRLEGEVPYDVAGQEVEVTLIASSNTGGNSEPRTIRIPVAYDPEKKPVIESFELKRAVGTNLYEHLSGYIRDPAGDPSLRVILDKVEPAAPWLHISSLNPTVLEGTVPDEATGQEYQLTLRANTSIGGSSDPIITFLQIVVDEEQTPQFKSGNPLIPMLYPGQPFIYDFVASKDIYPEYDDAPYEIKFAENYEHPSWLRIEDNKMIADIIPEDINSKIKIHITIKNVPGGQSHAIPLLLRAMN